MSHFVLEGSLVPLTPIAVKMGLTPCDAPKSNHDWYEPPEARWEKTFPRSKKYKKRAATYTAKPMRPFDNGGPLDTSKAI